MTLWIHVESLETTRHSREQLWVVDKTTFFSLPFFVYWWHFLLFEWFSSRDLESWDLSISCKITSGFPAIPLQFYIKTNEKKGLLPLKRKLKYRYLSFFGVDHHSESLYFVSIKKLVRTKTNTQLNSVPYLAESLVWKLESSFFGNL